MNIQLCYFLEGIFLVNEHFWPSLIKFCHKFTSLLANVALTDVSNYKKNNRFHLNILPEEMTEEGKVKKMRWEWWF